MQPEPRVVVAANKEARALFNKNLAEIEGHKDGDVFDCIHAFSEKGCGLDEKCVDCWIKGAVLDTFATGTPHDNVKTILDIKKEDGIIPYAIVVSTEAVGDFVLLTVFKYEKQ